MHEIKAQSQFDIDSNGEVSDEEAKVYILSNVHLILEYPMAVFTKQFKAVPRSAIGRSPDS